MDQLIFRHSGEMDQRVLTTVFFSFGFIVTQQNFVATTK
jgi:hypothetical protein